MAWVKTGDAIDAYLAEGIYHDDNGDREKAMKCFQRALKLDPNHLVSIHCVGHMHIRLGRVDEGIACFKSILARDPNHEPALLSLAAMYGDLGDYKKAIAYYDKVLDMEGVNIRAMQGKLRISLQIEAQKEIARRSKMAQKRKASGSKRTASRTSTGRASRSPKPPHGGRGKTAKQSKPRKGTGRRTSSKEQ